VYIRHGYSTDVVADFDSAYFDWIYIDSAHSYDVTRDELRAYARTVKPNGMMAGHDYKMTNWRKHLRYGVVEAVHEFCVEFE